MTGSGRGTFIVFEGGEACGKSTQARILADELGAVLTREPGGTPFGRRLRDVLLDPGTGAVDPRAEAMMMAADRAQHVLDVVRPALDAGRHVVSDRYVGSSIAYQGYGRGLDPAWVRSLSDVASDDLQPDLVILLEVSAEQEAVRLGDERDRFESAGAAFHERVRSGYRAQADEDPQRWVRLDGAASIDDVAAEVRAVVRQRLQLVV